MIVRMGEAVNVACFGAACATDVSHAEKGGGMKLVGVTESVRVVGGAVAIRIENLAKSFGELRVLNGLNASFPKSGLVGIAGPSGVGKTTLLRIIAGLEVPDEGGILGVPRRISVMFEDDRLFPWMDAAANVSLVGCSEAHARELLRELNLAEEAHSRIASLSGGQRRRVALARALAYPAPLYLLDEPTARLDAKTAEVALNAIERHCQDALVLMSSHSPQTLAHCRTVISL